MLTRKATTARVAAYLEMCDFPSTKQELLQMANEQEFPDDVLDVLEDLPERRYTCESDAVEHAAETVERSLTYA